MSENAAFIITITCVALVAFIVLIGFPLAVVFKDSFWILVTLSFAVLLGVIGSLVADKIDRNTNK